MLRREITPGHREEQPCARPLARRAKPPYKPGFRDRPDRRGLNVPTEREIKQGFTLTGYFLDQHIWGPRDLAEPEERVRFVALGTAGVG